MPYKDLDVRREASRLAQARYRAKHRSGRPPGRPAIHITVEAKQQARRIANLKASRKKYRQTRDWLNELKNKPCADCGCVYPPYVMDFDHRPGEIKLFDVSKTMARSVRDIEAEVAKCDLVCSNCHRVRTHNRTTEQAA